ncbi:MAG: thioesterase family protein [Natronospirillum sp.]
MLSETFLPRFDDTDALGHINNTRIPVWFEGARTPVFRCFTPDLDIRQWRLMIARYDIQFHGELFYGEPVEIRTWVSRLGNSSFDVSQEVWQRDERRASGVTVMVHFDHQAKRTQALTDDIRAALTEL